MICPYCGTDPSEEDCCDKDRCDDCDGTGMVFVPSKTDPASGHQIDCPECGGEGKIEDESTEVSR